MAEITAALVKELRERTAAGMMECKKALVESNGDVELAIENMRKAGAIKAAKKAGRVAAEGVVVAKSAADGKLAALVEVNCETDFVARDASFLAFANAVGDAAIAGKLDQIEALSAAKLASGETVEEARAALVVKIGENITVRRSILVGAETVVGTYIHSGRIGVAVALKGGDAELAKQLAMHVAAANPLVVNPSDVPADIIAKEKEIAAAKAAESGKPANIVEKMVEGSIAKYVKEVALVGQAFVMDTNTTVGDLVKSKGAEIVSFVRLEVGEGIEKQETDFAAEVAAMAKGV